jgi:succinoglycan biosynthesis transport protein ExoP
MIMNAAIEKPSGLPVYLAAARHRRGPLIAAFAFGLTVTILLASLLPPKFRSAGTILIEQQEMPQELVRSTVTSYADERVQVISKRVMTTETLLNIIHRYDLYPKLRATATREALLKQMSKDIGLKMISADVIDPRSGHPTSATIAFEVSYTSGSPDQAAKVANELTTLYLNENLNNRTQLARDAATFLKSEGDQLDQRIGELEAQLAKFKDKHFHQLPELTQLNMQLLDHTDEDLRGQEARKASLEQQRVFLEAQLALLKPNSTVFSDTGERIVSSTDRLKMARSQLDSAKAMYGPDHPDVVRLQRQVNGLETQLAASRQGADSSSAQGLESAAAAREGTADLRRKLESTRAALAEAVGRYSPEHPDRVRLQHEVEALEAQVAALPAPAAAPSKLKPTEADNPAYVQIQAQLAATVNDLAALDEQVAKLRTRSGQYEKDVSLAPQVEQQYRELMRDYDNTRLKYQEIRSKQSEAKTAQNLEADRKGERFTLIDPPLPPEEPVSPNRRLILVAGIVLSLGLVAGVLWLLETFDSSVRGRLDLMILTGVPPLALVPHIGTEAERRAGRRRLHVAMGGAVASLCVAVVLTHFFYQPLDVMWFLFARRLGF